jgi:hypothetical protein
MKSCSVVSYLFVLAGLFSALHAQVAPNLPTLTTVQDLDLSAYLGRWFMMYSSQVPLNTYLKGANCVVDDHKPLIGGLNGDNKPIEAEFTMAISFK